MGAQNPFTFVAPLIISPTAETRVLGQVDLGSLGFHGGILGALIMNESCMLPLVVTEASSLWTASPERKQMVSFYKFANCHKYLQCFEVISVSWS